MKKLVVALTTCLLIQTASAMSASEAKSRGLVQERGDGYVSATSAEGHTVASHINSGRRAEYERIARSRGISVAEVARTAGSRLR